MEAEESQTVSRTRLVMSPPSQVAALYREMDRVDRGQFIGLGRVPRQRIGTPAPQKKSPIPDDMDLSKADGRGGVPAITVESWKLREEK